MADYANAGEGRRSRTTLENGVEVAVDQRGLDRQTRGDSQLHQEARVGEDSRRVGQWIEHLRCGHDQTSAEVAQQGPAIGAEWTVHEGNGVRRQTGHEGGEVVLPVA